MFRRPAIILFFSESNSVGIIIRSHNISHRLIVDKYKFSICNNIDLRTKPNQYPKYLLYYILSEKNGLYEIMRLMFKMFNRIDFDVEYSQK